MVVLVVLRAERLEQEVLGNESGRRLEAVRDEGHLDIVSPVASVKTGGGRTIASALATALRGAGGRMLLCAMSGVSLSSEPK